jgi:hypothetical protein
VLRGAQVPRVEEGIGGDHAARDLRHHNLLRRVESRELAGRDTGSQTDHEGAIVLLREQRGDERG